MPLGDSQLCELSHNSDLTLERAYFWSQAPKPHFTHQSRFMDACQSIVFIDFYFGSKSVNSALAIAKTVKFMNFTCFSSIQFFLIQ